MSYGDNIGSGNGLLPDGAKPFPAPMFKNQVRSCGIYMREILQEMLKISMFAIVWYEFENHWFKITAASPRDQSVKGHLPVFELHFGHAIHLDDLKYKRKTV